MIDTKKEQERDELHRAIWAIADELRGAVDGWDFKNYVLGTMFYRYISENLTNYINAGEQDAGNTDFDYAKMSDADAEEAREGLVEEKGFFIPPSELFCNVNSRADNDENGISKRIGLLLSGEDIQRDNDERPDFMRISSPSGDHGSVVLGIEHFRVDHFSRELTNNRVGSYGIGYEKNLKRSVDTWQPQISSDKEIPAGALKSIGELVAQLLSQQIQATYNSFISAFSYSLNKHIESIDFYHSQFRSFSMRRHGMHWQRIFWFLPI